MTGLPPVAGLRWAGNGSATLSGALLDLADRLDRRFRTLARRWDATEMRFPALIPAAALERIDYFRSFPHLVTFPACLEAVDDNLERFSAGDPVTADGQVRPSRLDPIRDVLTPAVCYHLYHHFTGARFAAPSYFTTTGTCFRREDSYLPLERQWSFTMRELVCIGPAPTTHTFLEQVRADVDILVTELGLPSTWAVAADPFFRPSRNPKYLMQRIDPTKHELMFDNRMAIVSANLHHDHFGRAFDMKGASDGEPMHTACVAFGLERWLAAVVRQHGPAPAGWPPVAGP
jgi:seryl-tRNA synthetase